MNTFIRISPFRLFLIVLVGAIAFCASSCSDDEVNNGGPDFNPFQCGTGNYDTYVESLPCNVLSIENKGLYLLPENQTLFEEDSLTTILNNQKSFASLMKDAFHGNLNDYVNKRVFIDAMITTRAELDTLIIDNDEATYNAHGVTILNLTR